MSEYLHVEKPFLDQLRALGWTVIDQGHGFIPSDPTTTLRTGFREWILPQVFRNAVRSTNVTQDGKPWLTDQQLDDLRDQLLRQPNRTLLEANEAAQALFLKAQVDRNEVTGEVHPVVRLIDFAHPERNRFHAINQFRIDTPGCVKTCIIPDVVLFVNGIPLVVVEAKIGDPNTANPLHSAFEQLLRYRNGRPETIKASLREGDGRHGAQGQARPRYQVRGPLPGAHGGGAPRHQEEVRGDRRHPRGRAAPRCHRQGSCRPLHRQHSAGWLQGPGRVPFEAGCHSVPEGDSGRAC